MSATKPRMTRNDYWNWIREDVSRTRLGHEIEIIPLDLERFSTITLGNKNRIDKWFHEETTSKRGNYMLRGRATQPYAEASALGLEIGAGGNGYSWWAYSDVQRLIYTYCEGDTTLNLFEDVESYLESKVETHKFYTEQF